MPVYFTRPGICATPWVANDHRGMEIDIVVKGSEPLHTPFRLDLRRHLLEGTVTGLVPSGQIDDIWTF